MTTSELRRHATLLGCNGSTAVDRETLAQVVEMIADTIDAGPTRTTRGSIESVNDVLTEAYHLVFDVKDACTDKDTADARYLAYEACSKIADLMSELGFDAPVRFDGQGR